VRKARKIIESARRPTHVADGAQDGRIDGWLVHSGAASVVFGIHAAQTSASKAADRFMGLSFKPQLPRRVGEQRQHQE